MAKVFGESGRYVQDAADREWRKMVLAAFSVTGFVFLVVGFILASSLPRASLPQWASTITVIGCAAAMVAVYKWALWKMTGFANRRRLLQRGAEGEDQVARRLADFPNEFYVINDLATPFGNIDHLVVGPTGVYILDAKSWRGVVGADGKGELTVNGQPTDKPHIRQFVARMLGIKDRVRMLAPGLDPYFQAVFVFTSARVEAKWGSTGSVHCIREDQLAEYIVGKDFGKQLGSEDTRRLAQAFLALAHMDRDFTDRATAPASESAAAPGSRGQHTRRLEDAWEAPAPG